MKKIVSLLLCAVIMFTATAVAFAKTDKPSPILFVAGLNTCDLMLDGEAVFPPSGDTITTAIKGAILPAAKSVATLGGWDSFAKALCGAANEIFEPVKMKADTTSKYDVYIEDSPRYSTSAELYERGENYFFTYDWRYSPLDIAELLNVRIDEILESTGCEKITLYTHSMGGCVLTSYLEKYGHSKVDRLLITDPAFKGMDFIADLFTGNMKLDPDILTNFLTYLLGSTDYAWAGDLIEVLNTLRVTDGVCAFGNNVLLKNMFDTVCAEMSDFFFLLPCFWAFCPAASYETAKKYAFGDKPDARYKPLIEKSDYYIYNVQAKVKDILDSCIADGIPVSIVCAYNSPAVPVGLSGFNQSDGIIDTKYASAGAVCAPYKKKFDEGYVQKFNDGHNHISADNAIDASSCIYPESTWFIKNVKHADLTKGINDFYSWLLNFDGQPNINSNSSYPQFLDSNGKTGELLPLQKDETQQSFFNRILAAIDWIISLIFKILHK